MPRKKPFSKHPQALKAQARVIYFGEGLPVKTVARRLGVPLATVYTWLVRDPRYRLPRRS